MHELRVAVICPMAIEREAVETQLLRAGLIRTRQDDDGVVSEFVAVGGSIGRGPSVRVIQCGIGKIAVIKAVEGLAADPSRVPPGLVILAGAAGGLAQTVDVPRIARVVVERSREDAARASSINGWQPSDAPGVANQEGAVALVGVDRVIATPKQKRELAEATGAAVVDMESHAFAAACERLGLVWTVVRGVSDTPDETLPGIVVNWIDAGGNTRSWRAARDLVLRPWLVPHMLKVMKRTNTVLPKVGLRVVELVQNAAAIQTGAQLANSALGGYTRTVTNGAAPAGKSEGAAPITPMPLPSDAKVGTAVLVGGTFDPPHRAHVEMAMHARDLLASPDDARVSGGTWLVFIPAARSPHKDRAPRTSDADRVVMLMAAVQDGGETEAAHAIIWTDELDRAMWERAQPGGTTGGAGASYFVDTLRRARRELDERADGLGQAGIEGRAALKFVIGADQAARFHLWHDARGILDLAEPVVLPRDNVRTGGELRDLMGSVKTPDGKSAWTDEECRWWGTRLVEIPPRDVSASSVRAALEGGTDPTTLTTALSPGVARMIRERSLYRS